MATVSEYSGGEERRGHRVPTAESDVSLFLSCGSELFLRLATALLMTVFRLFLGIRLMNKKASFASEPASLTPLF